MSSQDVVDYVHQKLPTVRTLLTPTVHPLRGLDSSAIGLTCVLEVL